MSTASRSWVRASRSGCGSAWPATSSADADGLRSITSVTGVEPVSQGEHVVQDPDPLTDLVSRRRARRYDVGSVEVRERPQASSLGRSGELNHGRSVRTGGVERY